MEQWKTIGRLILILRTIENNGKVILRTMENNGKVILKRMEDNGRTGDYLKNN